ncbi:protein containing DUF559 [Candidatus Magnetomorum sp. HK-1]|nr:protein containing DUF559 [Candidatus Magnetomorum sp. HK-1]
MNNKRQRHETDIEKILRLEIERRGYVRGIDFSVQFPLRYGHIIDIAFPLQKVAVEADGLRWHSSKKAKERDNFKNYVLRKKGFTVLRFSDEEIYKDVSRCVDVIEANLK